MDKIWTRARVKFDILAIFLTLMNWPFAWRLGVGVTAVILVAAFHHFFLRSLDGSLVYIDLFPAVAAAALIGGNFGGGIATMLSALTALLETPSRSLTIVVLGLAAFLVSCGVITGIAGMLRMALQRSVAAEGLRDDEGWYKTVFNSSTEGIVTIDNKGVILAANPAVGRMFGYETSEMLGHNINMLMPEPDRAGHDAYVATYLGKGATTVIGLSHKLEGLRKNGEIFRHELTINDAMVNQKVLFIGFIRDLTQIENEKRQTEAVREELLHVSRLSDMSEAAAGLAHEVSQPLTAILTLAAVARRALPPTTQPSIAHIMEVIETEARSATDMLKGLRGFIEKRESRRAPENLAKLIEDALALAAIRSNGRLVRIMVKPARDVFIVNVDRVQIIQVLVNFLRNASDAMTDESDPEVLIETALETPGMVRVDVSDNGSGVDPKVSGQLFAPFVTTKSFGMGIGLSLCKTIIESHKGAIGYGANTPKGAKFWFTLPIFEGVAEGDEPLSAR